MAEIQQKLAPSNLPLPSPKVPPSPKSPQPLKVPREPHLARTNSCAKPPKRTSTEKYFKAKDLEKELKYSRPQKPDNILENSFTLSQANPKINYFFAQQLEESQETVHKGKQISRGKQHSRENHLRVSFGVERDQEIIGKDFDVLSGISGSKPKRGEDYYSYWKKKAHDYLETNIKLMAEIRKLTTKNQQLEQELSKGNQEKGVYLYESDKRLATEGKEASLNHQEETSRQLRANTLHYLSKIESMEKELKKKEVAIAAYQQQIVHLHQRISGDTERLKLMGRMRLEIQQLQRQLQKEDCNWAQSSNSIHTLQINSPSKRNTIGSAQLWSGRNTTFSQVTQGKRAGPRNE